MRVLSQILGKADVAHPPGDTGDQPAGRDPPDEVDRALRRGPSRRSLQRAGPSCYRRDGLRGPGRRSLPAASSTGGKSATSNT